MRRQHILTRVGAVALGNRAVVATRELFVVFFVIVFEVQMGLNAELTFEKASSVKVSLPMRE